MNDYKTAIVFQGGGALGAFEYGVIKALYEKRPGFKPAVVTGVSIGAINAALLVAAKKDPLEALDEAWCRRFTEILPLPWKMLTAPFIQRVEQYLSALGNPGMYQLRQDHLLTPCQRTSIYELEPLRRTLRDLVDLEKLKPGDGTRLVLGAINVATGKPEDFDSYIGPLTIDHVIASGSIPPAFPMTRIGNKYYWDGGLFQNTPLSSAINCLEDIEDCLREIIVVQLFPANGALPNDSREVMNRLGQILFASKFKIDQKLFKTVNAIITFLEKLDPIIPADLKNDPAYRLIFKQHSKIDALTVITAEFPEEQADAADFSPETIESRIQLGYLQATDQHIEKPHPVEELK